MPVGKPWRRRRAAELRYLWALLKRFKVTFLLLVGVQLGGSAGIWFGEAQRGHSIRFAKAMAATYFLMMGQPSLDLPDTWALVALEAALPVLGLAVIADGLVRFGYLFFAKQRNDKEWIAVQAQSMKAHVVVCGAGRVGYRVVVQLHRLGVDVVVVELNEHAPFVSALRDLGVPLLIADARSAQAQEAVRLRGARALVCATDDDLANLNIALDARRVNPAIRVVMRLFDDDLVKKVRDSFGLEALSTSAMAAPAFAMTALDPSIRTSFELEGELMVVGETKVGSSLAGRTVGEIHDALQVGVIRLSRGGAPFADVVNAEKLEAGDVVLVRARLEDYRRLRGDAST
jgi:voltage-gated potassium channel